MVEDLPHKPATLPHLVNFRRRLTNIAMLMRDDLPVHGKSLRGHFVHGTVPVDRDQPSGALSNNPLRDGSSPGRAAKRGLMTSSRSSLRVTSFGPVKIAQFIDASRLECGRCKSAPQVGQERRPAIRSNN